MNSLREQLQRYIDANGIEFDWTVDTESPVRVVDCTTCGDTGFVVTAHWNEDRTHYSEQSLPCPERCPAVQRNLESRYQKLIAKAPLPVEYRDATLDDWFGLVRTRQSDLLRGKWLGLGAAMAFIDNAPIGHWFRLEDAYGKVDIQADVPNAHIKNSIVLAGRPGVGKTTMAAAIVNALHAAEEPIPALYMRVSTILDALREPFNNSGEREYYHYGETEQQILRTFSQAPVLVLDEFNLTRASDYSRQRLEDIMRYRMMHQLPTVMTTNLSFDEFNNHWGERVGHAVQGMAHWIIVGGVELRRRGGPVESV